MTFLEMIHVWQRLLFLRPIGLSIDITDRCPLSCAGCYMKWYERNADLPLERWEEIIASFPASERTFCAWTGGEPLLRAGDVRALSRHFSWSWIATNGTVPIPDIRRTTVFVSVDGPEEVHDSLRGGWREIVKHVRPEHYIACTVRRENSSPETLRELTEFWHRRARGIVFGFLTPRKEGRPTENTPGERPATEVTELTEAERHSKRRGAAERLPSVASVSSVANVLESESLDRDERARVVRALRELRREFGSFVLGVPGQATDCARLAVAAQARTAWGDRCPAEAVLVTFDAGGRRKRPCTLGADVDCGACGCAVPAFLRRVRRLDVRTLVGVAGLFRGR